MKKLKGHLDRTDMINEEAAVRCFQSPNKNIHSVIKKQFCQFWSIGKKFFKLDNTKWLS